MTSPEKISDLFLFLQKPCNFRHNRGIQRRNDRTVFFGTECVSLLAPKLCELLSDT